MTEGVVAGVAVVVDAVEVVDEAVDSRYRTIQGKQIVRICEKRIGRLKRGRISALREFEAHWGGVADCLRDLQEKRSKNKMERLSRANLRSKRGVWYPWAYV